MRAGALALMAVGGGALLATLAPAFATAPDGEGGTDAASGGDRQCFFARQVTGFRNVEDEEGRRDDTRVLVDVGARDTYEFELMRRCPGLRFARSVALVRKGPGRICDGLDVDLVVQEDISPVRCPVTMVRKLPADDPNARAGARD